MRNAMTISGLNEVGSSAQIYEVAKSGLLGNVKEVEQSNLYQFISVLDFLRRENKFTEVLSEQHK